MNVHVVIWQHLGQKRMLDVDDEGTAEMVAIRLVEMGRHPVSLHTEVNEPEWWAAHVAAAQEHVERGLRALIGGGHGA
jgi:hypothetical protein